MTIRLVVCSLILAGGVLPAPGDERPSHSEVQAALDRAIAFYHGSVASHGGYVYSYSSDLSLREGEGTTGPTTIWVQPPGTPTVGEAFLDAYDATGGDEALSAARDAARALILGQLQSGGWSYSIEFDPAARDAIAYRLDLDGTTRRPVVKEKDRAAAGDWDVWKRRPYKSNVTTLDDDVTQAATRFLIRLDKTLDFKDDTVHEAAMLALTSLLRTQYPNGGWSANYDRLPDQPPLEADYPILSASYPEEWSRTWPKDFTGCYVTNDNLVARMIDTLLVAHEVYGDDRYLAAAKRAGDFLLAAQMPEPQPAWAQQYDRQMHPCWSRAFEPPAISGGESQQILAALMDLSAATGDAKYRKPVPRAIAYLRRSLRPDGRLARFYELETNRPLYFRRDNGRHTLTYDDDRLATGYGYIVDSRLDALEARFRRPPRARRSTPPAAAPAAEVRSILAAQDERGAWIEPGRLRHHKVEPSGGIVDSATFARNVTTLSRYLAATR